MHLTTLNPLSMHKWPRVPLSEDRFPLPFFLECNTEPQMRLVPYKARLALLKIIYHLLPPGHQTYN